MKHKHHYLKTWPIYFQAVKRGKKTFEVRKNDRDFKVGDLVTLESWNPKTGKYTKPHTNRNMPITLIIEYILKGPAFGIKSGYCVMQLGIPF